MAERIERGEAIRGFWRTAWRHRREVLLSWDIGVSLLVSSLAGVFTPEIAIERNLTYIAGTELGVASVLVGIILAGLAILVVFLNEEYLAILSRTKGGLQADIFPFWFTGALGVLSISFNVLVILFGADLVVGVQRIVLGASTWFFLWTVFAVLNLIAFVAGHVANRSRQIILESENKKAQVKK